MSEIAVFVASHGDFGKALISSAELIIGEQKNTGSFGIHIEDEISQLEIDFREELHKLDLTNGVVILVDLFGGTPMNIGMRQLFELDNALLVTGVNLPMFIELSTNRNKTTDEIKLVLEETYKLASIAKTSQDVQRKDEEDGDQIL